jgi:hypothetical protein
VTSVQRLFFTLLALMAAMQIANAAPKLSAADKAWIDKCANRLVTESEKKPVSAHIYCTCMHEMVENNEEMSQSDLEHSWPPVHISCRRKAGWHREKNP